MKKIFTFVNIISLALAAGNTISMFVEKCIVVDVDKWFARKTPVAPEPVVAFVMPVKVSPFFFL